jgi:hypothetical protein
VKKIIERYETVKEALSEIDLKDNIKVSDCEVVKDSLKFVTTCSGTVETLVSVKNPNKITIEAYLKPLENFVNLCK